MSGKSLKILLGTFVGWMVDVRWVLPIGMSFLEGCQDWFDMGVVSKDAGIGLLWP
jgi:hypothetical protein